MFHSFFRAISLNILNLFLYKFILQTHTYCLFLVTSKELFGLSGTIFSAIYFLISITNFGFDYFIITHHNDYIKSQRHIKKIYQLLATKIILLAALLFVVILYNQHFISFTHLPPYLLCIASLIFISESLKKSLDIIAQMSFLQKTITILDLSSIIAYVTLVWTAYFYLHTTTLYIIFIPMSIISIIECIALGYRLYKSYQALPQTHPDKPLIVIHSTQTMLQLAYNYFNQITKALFSPNFFIIIFAYKLGVSKAGYIKLFTDIIILLYMLLNRSFGLPSAALFLFIAHKHPSDYQLIKDSFIKITNWYIQFLYIVAATLISAVIAYTPFCPDITSVIFFNILLFIFAGFIEYIIIIYEKWYITQKRSYTLAAINICNIIPYCIVLFVFSYLTAAYILLSLIMIRLCSMFFIMYKTYHIWTIKPSWSVQQPTAIISGLISLLVCTYIIITKNSSCLL